MRADDDERDGAALSMPFDPRQGTLLGFEVPADLLVAKADEDAPTDVEPAAPADAEPAAPADAEPAAPAEPQGPVGGQRVTEGKAAITEKSSMDEKPVAIERSPAVEEPVAPEGSRGFDRTATSAIAMTVASLEEAFVEERGAADERWRRTRRWLAVAVGGLALLLVVCIAQTIALIGFAHSVQDTQAQLQSAVNQQQAALANLASAPSALATGLQSTDGQVSAPDAASAASAVPPPVKHARSAHRKHFRERPRATYTGH